MRISNHVAGTVLGALASAFIATRLPAQVCRGTPSHGGLAYEYGTTTVGHTQGVSAALGGGRKTLGLGLRSRDLGQDATGVEALLRFSLGFGAGPVQICPGLGLGYANDEWEADDNLTLHTRAATARAGMGVGTERTLYKEFSIIPFLVVQYEFTAKAYTLDAPPGADTDITGDTLSRVDIEYGLLGHYKFVYGGLAAQRNTDRSGNRPYMARWIVGFAFRGGDKNKAAKSESARMRRDPLVRSPKE